MKNGLPTIAKTAQRARAAIEEMFTRMARKHRYSVGTDLRAAAKALVVAIMRCYRESDRDAKIARARELGAAGHEDQSGARVILHFKQTMFLEAQNGDYTDERMCIEHPRITQLQQSSDGNVVTTFFVDQAALGFGTLDQALDALRADPRDGDIVAVPPINFGVSAVDSDTGR